MNGFEDKHILIFNYLWYDICEGENDEELGQPIGDKELAIWKSKDKKAFALIATFASEYVSMHIISCKTICVVLKKLKDLYDSHSKLEII
jgi:hypothetical protein